MAEETKDGGEGAEGAAPAKPKIKLNPQVILVVANTLCVLAALGMTVFTRMLYQKPAIVEHAEIGKKQEELKTHPVPTEKILVPFDQLMVNIAITSGKAHYATVAFSVECRDEGAAATLKKTKALFVDKVIAALGRRQITELNTIQGKLLLKSELMRAFNGMLNPGAVTDMYFSAFILQ